MNIIVVAPHPDDETFGCGGTLLRHAEEGDDIHWMIVTRMDARLGYTDARIKDRNDVIKRVSQSYAFKSVKHLGFPTTTLCATSMSEIVGKISEVFHEVQPNVVYLPSKADIHTDHSIVHKAVSSCCKWFRFPFVKRVLSYETLSETDFGLDGHDAFTPNVFVDITAYLERKIKITQVYNSELGEPPFPRSVENIRALSMIRGSASGFIAAEAFVLMKEIR